MMVQKSTNEGNDTFIILYDNKKKSLLGVSEMISMTMENMMNILHTTYTHQTRAIKLANITSSFL